MINKKYVANGTRFAGKLLRNNKEYENNFMNAPCYVLIYNELKLEFKDSYISEFTFIDNVITADKFKMTTKDNEVFVSDKVKNTPITGDLYFIKNNEELSYFDIIHGFVYNHVGNRNIRKQVDVILKNPTGDKLVKCWIYLSDEGLDYQEIKKGNFTNQYKIAQFRLLNSY